MADLTVQRILLFAISIFVVLSLLFINSRIVSISISRLNHDSSLVLLKEGHAISGDTLVSQSDTYNNYKRTPDSESGSLTSGNNGLSFIPKITRQPQLPVADQKIKTDITPQNEKRSLLRPALIFSKATIDSSKEKATTVSSHDVTLTSQGTMSRYPYFAILLKRWSGPFSITIHLKENETSILDRSLAADSFDSRLSIVRYISSDPNVYPINKLRNMAIQNTKTDHFWLTDMDMWPSLGLYEAILHLPAQYLDDPKLAIIIPAYEIHDSTCKSFEECTKNTVARIPGTKEQLVSCQRADRCSTFRPWDELHDYHFREWYQPTYRIPLTPVKCFKGNTQEPYVVVMKSSDLPKFDESFVNYAYNKVQWLEHLRYRGYSYSIITDGFAVDVPHPLLFFSIRLILSSSLRQQFMKTRETTHQTLNKEVYEAFIVHLRSTETDKSVVKYCHK